jgi:DNA-binding CsgD family transcriptional regulator
VAARSHDPDVVLYVAIREAEAALLDGRLEDARAAASRLLDQARALGNLPTAEHAAQRMTLLPLLYLGRVEEAEIAHAHTVRLSDLTDDSLLTHSGGSFAATRALVLAHGNRDDEAREVIHRTLQRLRIGIEDDETPAWSLVYLLEAATRAGDREAAAVLMARLAPIGSVVSSFGTATCVTRHLGAAAALLGDRAEARRYYEQALAVAGRVRFRPELALAELGLAELLVDGAGAEAAEAQEHLNLALAELWAMQMQPALDHARRLAARGAGGRRGAAAPALPDGLTVREVEVLRLLAAGSSNRRIAEALVLSVPTVQNHLAHIYHKIGARSRADATAYALRHRLAARPAPGPTPPDELAT